MTLAWKSRSTLWYPIFSQSEEHRLTEWITDQQSLWAEIRMVVEILLQFVGWFATDVVLGLLCLAAEWRPRKPVASGSTEDAAEDDAACCTCKNCGQRHVRVGWR